jgi:hypothetical protein
MSGASGVATENRRRTRSPHDVPSIPGECPECVDGRNRRRWSSWKTGGDAGEIPQVLCGTRKLWVAQDVEIAERDEHEDIRGETRRRLGELA